MYHYIKYYIVPLITASVIMGILMGGHWMWLGFGILCIVVIGGDAVLGDDPSISKYNYPRLLEVPLHLALPMVLLLLASLAWASGRGTQDFLGIGKLLSGFFAYDFFTARNASSWTDYLGAVIGTGFMVGGYGTVAAHELTHRIKDGIAMLEGRWLLSTSCNADFSIEHVYGHHVTVGTDADPATAKKGENVYAFFIRSTVDGHISAWKLELKRLRKRSYSVFSIRNRMFTGYFMSLIWIGLFYMAGGIFGIVLFMSQAVFAKFLLEVVNYMEHYGLIRTPDAPVRPEHSWNTNKRMSGMVLFSLTRHSAHHEKPRTQFWKLAPYVDAPQMPYGYLITLLICLIPPVWYYVITPGLDKWEKQNVPV